MVQEYYSSSHRSGQGIQGKVRDPIIRTSPSNIPPLSTPSSHPPPPSSRTHRPQRSIPVPGYLRCTTPFYPFILRFGTPIPIHSVCIPLLRPTRRRRRCPEEETKKRGFCTWFQRTEQLHARRSVVHKFVGPLFSTRGTNPEMLQRSAPMQRGR